MQQPSTNRENDEPGSLFPETLWPLVLEVKAKDPEKARAALAELCVIYRKPVVNWLRGNGHKEDAEDLASAFILCLHQRDHFSEFERKEGTKFRSFLLTCLQHLVRDERERACAVKRNKGMVPVPLEDHDVSEQPQVAREFDQGIALEIHRRVVEKIAPQDNGRLVELQRFLFGRDPSVPYSQVAAQLGISEGAVKVAVSRLRESYYDAFCAEVAQIAQPDECDNEFKYLIGLLSDAQ